MIVNYVSDDGILVSVCHVGAVRGGTRARWQVMVQNAGGIAGWGVPDLDIPLTWSAERAAREALAWAQSQQLPPCDCENPACPGQSENPALEVFGPTEATEVRLHGPYFDTHEAQAYCLVKAGMLDEDRAGELLEADMPTLAELVAELDGKPKRDDPPADPRSGATWNLG